MLELGAGADILRSLGNAYVGVLIVSLILSVWLPKRRWQKIALVLIVLGVFTGPALFRGREQDKLIAERKAKYEEAKALFDERCKTAGEKIYRTVEGVEGVELNSVRGKLESSNSSNQYWEFAGFPGESSGTEFIKEFLYYNKPPEGNAIRTLSAKPGGVKGYRFVDVVEDGRRMRYTLREEAANTQNPASTLVGQDTLRQVADAPPARYLVTYQNMFEDVDGRAHWVAGGRVAVTDQITDEVLGEFVRYAFDPDLGSTAGGRQPWFFAKQCPETKYGSRLGHIRTFVDQVIKPKQGS